MFCAGAPDDRHQDGGRHRPSRQHNAHHHIDQTSATLATASKGARSGRGQVGLVTGGVRHRLKGRCCVGRSRTGISLHGSHLGALCVWGSESRRGVACRKDRAFHRRARRARPGGSAERDLGWHVDLRRVRQGRVKAELVNPAGLASLPSTPDRLDRAQHAPGRLCTRTRSCLFTGHGRILETHRRASVGLPRR
jgi:hypothetical protein